jgi:hypothetical protein
MSISGGDRYGYTPGTVPATLQGQANKQAWDAANRKSKSNLFDPVTLPSTAGPYLPLQSVSSKIDSPSSIYNPAPNYGYRRVSLDRNFLRLAVRIGPPRIMSESELKVARDVFGNHSSQFVRQTRQVGKRQSFLMKDCQVIQKEVATDKPNGLLSFYFRTTKFSRISARAIVDAFEQNGNPYGFDTEIQGASLNQLRKALLYELRRRLKVASEECKRWEERSNFSRGPEFSQSY